MSELIGSTLLNRYFLRTHVGSGGMADVYQAWDGMRSAQLAVKVLRRDLIHNPRFLQLFRQEAELLRTLNHPNIVRLYDFEQDGDTLFLVMDWVDGMDLRQAIAHRGKPYSPNEIGRILKPICSALNYAHQSQVYHCDIKPANILLHNDGRVLLTDFGIARMAGDKMAAGTPPYMAPEQFADDGVDGRTDVYALGVTLYEMLTGGTLPFNGNGPQTVGSTARTRIEWEHLNMPVPPVRHYNPAISAAVEAVMLTTMSKPREQRYPTPLALYDAFETASAAGSQPGTDFIETAFSPLPPVRSAPVRPPAPPPAVPPAVEGPHLLARKGDMAGMVITIPIGELRIGRSSSNQICLGERSVSRQHAALIRDQKNVYIRDLGSRLGTHVNGYPINGVAVLRDGDIIRIGHYQEFEYRR